uniref:Periplasmic serine protease, S41 family n=1 Tax=uncultured Flavobacteriia bacterium TaxID=212695 RepID=F4MN85_9BACT|nr:peptidase, S41 family [uncultured bacterium]CBL87598.1 periplasmic serine protease, S41 family [uncultured Flavobacteriia bacterium]
MSKNLFTLLIAFIMCLASCSFVSKDFDTSDKDNLIIQLITYVLDQAHYLDKEINNEFSEKVFDTFLENLDPYKRYFYASDIEEFSKYKYLIDDAFKNPNLDFFELVYKRYTKRMLESEKIFNDILSKPFDFNKNEVCECDFEELDYVKTKDQLFDRWRKLLKIYVIENYHNEIEDDLRKSKEDTDFSIRSPNLIEKKTRETLKETMQQNYAFISEEMQRSDWFSVYINSFVSQYDPNTSYLDPESKDRFDVDMSGNYAGIGARLQKKIDKVEITEVISGGPAWRDNILEKGDAILKVRQDKENEPVGILNMRLSEAVKLIKGKKGTKVHLTVKKVDGTVTEVTVKRDIVLLEETYIKSSIVEKDNNTYGLINIPKFYIDFDNQSNRDAAKDLRTEIERLKEQGIQGLVIDLRNNGGGALKTVVDMAGMFIKNGPVVQVKYFDKEKQVLSDRDRSVLWTGPLVILVNEGSASASEILAAAMQDYKRAIIIGGNQTWGKGTVQNVFPLNRMVRGNTNGDLGALRYTTQKYYRINGGSVQLEGVKSDINVPYRYKYLEFGEKDSENPLQWDEIDKVEFDTWNSNFNFEEAITKSNKRMANNEYLKLVDENAKWIKSVRDNKLINLNYDKFKLELEENSSITEKFKALNDYSMNYSFKSLPYELDLIKNDSVLGLKRERWHKSLNKDFYIDEALNVLSDLRFSYLDN